jgi:hypothetical protein
MIRIEGIPVVAARLAAAKKLKPAETHSQRRKILKISAPLGKRYSRRGPLHTDTVREADHLTAHCVR